jgi:glycosyltransferase involved in cell wall biosynthesis
VIYPSEISRDYAIKRFGLENEASIIPHGCDIPKGIKDYPQEFSPAYIGAMGPDKGIRYLVEAWSELGLKGEVLTFYGRESESLDWYVSKFARNGRFEKRGYFEALEDIIPEISIGVFPTATEGFNIGALELMSHGRPVVVTDGAGISELIDDGVDGFITYKRDIQGLKDAITYFKDNPTEIGKMGAQARVKATRYKWERIREQYQREYARLFN